MDHNNLVTSRRRESELTDKSCLDPLRGCAAFLSLLKAVRERFKSEGVQDTLQSSFGDLIDEFCTKINSGLRTVANNRSLWRADYSTVAKRCVDIVAELDICDSEPPGGLGVPMESVALHGSLFSDDFMLSIALYLTEEDIRENQRIWQLKADELEERHPTDDGMKADASDNAANSNYPFGPVETVLISVIFCVDISLWLVRVLILVLIVLYAEVLSRVVF